MIFDMHTHHERCGHARGTIEDYIREAIGYGLQVIGISDHNPLFYAEEDYPYPTVMMPKSEFPRYVAEVLRLKEQYRDKIDVLLGVEGDYYNEQHVPLYRAVFDQYPFDYVIGSCHMMKPGHNVFNQALWDGLDEQAMIDLKEFYLQQIQASVRTGMFDIIGHMDALKASYYAHVVHPAFPDFASIPTPLLDETLQLMAAREQVMEVNSAFLRNYSWKFGNETNRWYPSVDTLERAHHFGVRLSFGSDAHVPHHVAYEFEQVRETLRAIGYKQWYIFKARKPIALSL